MSRSLTTVTAAALAAAALSVSLSGCGGSSTSTTASSASSESAPASASSPAPAGAAAGSLAASCSKLDAVMEANPDADPAGTAAKLTEIMAGVTTPDADLIGALVDAYTAIADNPGVAAGSPEGQAMADALSSSAKSLGAACQSATTSPAPS